MAVNHSMEVAHIHFIQLYCSMLVEPFEDEVHPRLRFTHRGLVGMANNGEKHSNTSQFFLTLGMDRSSRENALR
jgi:cyclophilin family peptidyl-prolyl cis-trans isomerase